MNICAGRDDVLQVWPLLLKSMLWKGIIYYEGHLLAFQEALKMLFFPLVILTEQV